jgi:hypothetical protein
MGGSAHISEPVDHMHPMRRDVKRFVPASSPILSLGVVGIHLSISSRHRHITEDRQEQIGLVVEAAIGRCTMAPM